MNEYKVNNKIYNCMQSICMYCGIERKNNIIFPYQ